ncbi:MAG: deoxyribose-phosphate aldolase [Verrucomicrobia bacterium]|nr:deoxyribose-phosphate aldolase [Verrucomicrobiota bacterium]
MTLNVQALARLIDLSAVRTECDEAEIRELAAIARRFGVVCVFALPCYTRLLKSLLGDAPNIGIGGVVGFPSGAHTTAIKIAEVRQQLADGATELDMVINVGLLRSGGHEAVSEDLRAVVEAAGGVPVKVILECHWLTPEQIHIGSKLCVEAGAAWVKTGTGWAPTGATPANLTIIRDAVGGRAGIKAAGGVRDLATLVAMYRLGVRRFGIGAASGIRILEACAAQPGGNVEVS